MTRTGFLHSILLAAIASAPSLLNPGESLAQHRAGQRAGSLNFAIEEARRSPFHAAPQPIPPAVARDESAQMLRALERRTFSRDAGELAPKVFFFTLPVVAVVDGFFISAMTRDDPGPNRESGGFSLPLALGAIAAPALVGRLAGARGAVALVGSTLGFSSVVMATLMVGRPAFFLAPVLHAGATALLVAVGTRRR